MNRKIIVSGVGCCLVDRVYNNISFTSENFSVYLSKKRGDGGLTPGKLVFTEEFEKFSGMDFQNSLFKITDGKQHDKINIGGPGIVAIIHAAQMLENTHSECRFYGCGGKDEDGNFLLSSLKKTPVIFDSYKLTGAVTPSTVVLSDPGFDNGNGERIFINSIGAAWDYSPNELDDDFFTSDIVVFGGTALVPAIHDNLTEVLEKAKRKNCITIVNTVYDFRNEKANPAEKWPLGKSDESYKNTDLLITDREEALRLSGKTNLNSAFEFFQKNKTGAVIVTNGAENLHFFVNEESRFRKPLISKLPVSKAISEELKKGHFGDTTGCGDNFVGGVIASLVSQLQNNSEKPDLTEAIIWGIISGGYSCFYMGGTYFEETGGEKRNLIAPYYKKYINQIGG